MQIHFICRGNLLRSLIAETYITFLSHPHIKAKSSGTSVDWDDPQEQQYFGETIDMLTYKGIAQHAKTRPEQLTSARISSDDYVVFMNQRVVGEAAQLLPSLPANYEVWEITDIGEGSRTDRDKKQEYLLAIYGEITAKVDTPLDVIDTKKAPL